MEFKWKSVVSILKYFFFLNHSKTISALITLTKNSINFELNKLNKIFLINLKLTENARYIVDFLIESNSNLRK